MGKKKKLRTRIYDKINQYVTFFMKLSVIVAVILGLLQLHQSNRSEKRQIAIEAVSQTRTVEFLKALSRLKKGYKDKKINDYQTFRDDLNYIMSVYDNIAILFLNDVVDKCIIKEAVESGLNDFILILDSIEGFPLEYRKNLDLLRTKFTQQLCSKKN